MRLHQRCEFLVVRRIFAITMVASIAGVLGAAWVMYEAVL